MLFDASSSLRKKKRPLARRSLACSLALVFAHAARDRLSALERKYSLAVNEPETGEAEEEKRVVRLRKKAMGGKRRRKSDAEEGGIDFFGEVHSLDDGGEGENFQCLPFRPSSYPQNYHSSAVTPKQARSSPLASPGVPIARRNAPPRPGFHAQMRGGNNNGRRRGEPRPPPLPPPPRTKT